MSPVEHCIKLSRHWHYVTGFSAIVGLCVRGMTTFPSAPIVSGPTQKGLELAEHVNIIKHCCLCIIKDTCVICEVMSHPWVASKRAATASFLGQRCTHICLQQLQKCQHWLIHLLLSAFSPALSKHVLLGLNANKCAMIGRLITAIAITISNTH